MISEYQVYLARYYQADAILLMLSVVNDETYRVLADLAHSLGMGVLTETSNEEEFERALALGAKIIGVNNRNLHDLTVDLNRVVELTQKYADRIPADARIISESGIYNHSQIRDLQKVAHGFLIGSSLMGSADLNNAVREVIFGENKVCGLTRTQDVKEVYAHGSETAEFITALRHQLPEETQIWKAISVDTETQSAVDFTDDLNIARYIFDSQSANQQGGTGKTFNWSVIPENLKHKIILAGGISPDNIEQAIKQGCLGVDLNSGVETATGIKDSEKVRSVFKTILSN